MAVAQHMLREVSPRPADGEARDVPSHLLDDRMTRISGRGNLANRTSEGLRCRALPRATIFLALAFGFGLASATSAVAAPPDNPFDESKPADEKAEPATPPESETPPPAPTPPPAAESSGSESTGEPEAQTEEEGDGESESSLHALTCLEGDSTGGRRKGVQKR